MPPEVAYFVSYGMVAGFVVASASIAPSMRGRSWGWLAIPALTILGCALVKVRGDNAVVAAIILACVLWGCGTLGSSIGHRVEKAGYLFVVAVLSSAVDVVSVFAPRGVTAQVVQDEVLLSVLAISWPMAGFREIFPLLGMGDVTMTALYFGAARRHGLRWGRGIAAFLVGYALTAMSVFLLEVALPALPFLAFAALAAWPEARVVPKEERRQAYVGIAIVVLGLWLAFYVF